MCLKEIERGIAWQLHLWLVKMSVFVKRDHKLYEEGLSSKVKLSLYKTFSKEVGF